MKLSIECHWIFFAAVLAFLFWGRGGAQPAPQPQPSPTKPTTGRKSIEALDAEVLTAMGLELAHE